MFIQFIEMLGDWRFEGLNIKNSTYDLSEFSSNLDSEIARSFYVSFKSQTPHS